MGRRTHHALLYLVGAALVAGILAAPVTTAAGQDEPRWQRSATVSATEGV